MAALTARPLIYKYVAGKHPLGVDKIKCAGRKIARTARDMKEMAKAKSMDSASSVRLRRLLHGLGKMCTKISKCHKNFLRDWSWK